MMTHLTSQMHFPFPFPYEMSKNYLFRINNYLTEAGEELFEDAWFEWYHEHHGDIVSRVLQRLEP